MSMSAAGSLETFSLFELGDRLAKSRKKARISAADMAEILGVHRNSIGNYEAGRQTPSLGLVIAWAVITRQPLSWLMGQDFPLSERAATVLSNDAQMLEFFPGSTEVSTLLVLASARHRFALEAPVSLRDQRPIAQAS